MITRYRTGRAMVLGLFVIGSSLAGCSSDDASQVKPAGQSIESSTSRRATNPTETEFVAEVWADNWFSVSANGRLVGEDSVPITTERSFNSETVTFRASFPLHIAMITKDYKADGTGLEYIGTPRQQMGDSGFIAQIREKASGRVVLTTNSNWRGLVAHRAPLDPACEKSTNPTADCRFETVAEPPGWSEPDFDSSGWEQATVYTAAQVDPKDGYDQVTWDPQAALIWSGDLNRDNTILWRAPTVTG